MLLSEERLLSFPAERCLLLIGQYPGGDLDKVPDVPGHKLVLTVAGVEMAVVLVILQREELSPALAAVFVNVDAGQDHAAACFQGHPPP